MMFTFGCSENFITAARDPSDELLSMIVRTIVNCGMVKDKTDSTTSANVSISL